MYIIISIITNTTIKELSELISELITIFILLMCDIILKILNTLITFKNAKFC